MIDPKYKQLIQDMIDANAKALYEQIEKLLFEGDVEVQKYILPDAYQIGLSQKIVDYGYARGLLRNQLAYVLATAKWETQHTFKPIEENLNYTTAARIKHVWPKRFTSLEDAQQYVRNPQKLANKVYNGRMGNEVGSNDGWTYRGRGLSMITGRDNYAKFGYANNPDLVLQPDTSVNILVDGMINGTFTGKKLSDYITLSKSSFKEAREIINGTDQASTIAELAVTYDKVLKSIGYGEE